MKTVRQVWESIPLKHRLVSHITLDSVGLVLDNLMDELENSDRWRFLTAVFADADGPESRACSTLTGRNPALTDLTVMSDAARDMLKYNLLGAGNEDQNACTVR